MKARTRCPSCDRPLERERISVDVSEPPLELHLREYPVLACPEGHGPWNQSPLSESMARFSEAIGEHLSGEEGFWFWKKDLCARCDRPIEDAPGPAGSHTLEMDLGLGDHGKTSMELAGPMIPCRYCGHQQLLSTGRSMRALGKVIGRVFDGSALGGGEPGVVVHDDERDELKDREKESSNRRVWKLLLLLLLIGALTMLGVS